MRILTIVVLLLLVFALLPTYVAADNTIIIDGKELTFNPAPITIEGRQLVPLRPLLENLGANIQWDDETQTAIGVLGNTEVTFPINCNFPLINGMAVKIEIPAQIIEGVTFAPLRFAGEAFGYSVNWDNDLEVPIMVKSNASLLPYDKDFSDAVIIETITGTASWYGNEFHGRRTASGEVFDQYDFTAAHRTLPFNTLIKVTFLDTGKSVIVRVNDRGPHKTERIIDLSRGAAEAIGLKPHGLGEVKLEVMQSFEDQE